MNNGIIIMNPKAIEKVWFNGIKPKRKYTKIIGKMFESNATDYRIRVLHKGYSSNEYAGLDSDGLTRRISRYTLRKYYKEKNE